MLKRYSFLLAVFFLFVSGSMLAQTGDGISSDVEKEEVSVYPNPVTNGKVYVSSPSDGAKEIEIYDILGKKVIQVIVDTDKEIDISSLKSGIYVITIKEENFITTRKLVVR